MCVSSSVSQAVAPDPGSVLRLWEGPMHWRGRGPGRSASRWIATATSVEPRWSPVAGSSLQLTASKTQMPLSKKHNHNPVQHRSCVYPAFMQRRVCRYSDARAWRAYMGMRVMTTGSNGAATRLIRRILLHPQYDQFTSDYDIALLELSTPVFFNELVQPVCMPAPSHSFTTGTNCYVTGWGVLMEDGESCSAV